MRPKKTSARFWCWRLLKELGAALLLFLMFALVAICQDVRAARQDVSEAVAETDRLDPGWRFEDLEAQRRLPPPERNSALQVLKVKSLLPRGWPHPPPDPTGANAADMEDWRNDPPPRKLEGPTRQLDPRDVRMMREALNRAGPALHEARKLAEMSEGRYPISWAADIDSTPCPWTDALYPLDSLLHYDALLRDEDGDPDGALITARAILNVGRSLGDEPFYYGPSNRLVRRFGAVSATERTLAQGQPSEEAMAAMQEALRVEDSVSLSLVYFRGHRALTHRFLCAVDDGKHRLSEWG
jgi:hypothetical protein